MPNLTINKCYQPALIDTSPYLILYGGAGSGKSFFGFQKVLLRLLTEQGHRILCIRKVRNTLRNSCFQLFKDLCSGLNVTINKSELRFTFENGNELIMLGLDDSEKIKSISGITSIIIEEATELSESDLMQLDLRLRDKTLHYKQMIIMFNPIDELHWLKARFFDKKSPQVSIYKTTYKDNSFISNEFKEKLENEIKANENMYKVYALGEWGRATTGGEFYKAFKFTQHTKPLNYNPDIPLHLSFDFNVHPYVTCIVSQVIEKDVFVIDEICLSSPQNYTQAVCKAVASKYKTHKAGMFVYGDPAGKHQDTRQKDRNDFSIIREALSQFNPQFRMLVVAPSVVVRGSFLNRIFAENYANISISINHTCTKLLSDMNYLKEAPDGTKLKEKRKDEKTGISYEMFGHTSDALDYFITKCFERDFKAYQRGGKLDAPKFIPRRANAKRY